jgi:superfamily II DNA or RNA helicase
MAKKHTVTLLRLRNIKIAKVSNLECESTVNIERTSLETVDEPQIMSVSSLYEFQIQVQHFNISALNSKITLYPVNFSVGVENIPVDIHRPNIHEIKISLNEDDVTIDKYLPVEDVFLSISIVNVPSLKNVRVFGYNYENRLLVEVTVAGDKPSERKTAKRQKSPNIETDDALILPRNRRKKESDVWDRIFYVLQPPLFDAGGEVITLPRNLYSFQVKGVDFLVNSNNALLADDMGTGKTVMSIVAIHELVRKLKVRKVLIVTPVSVLTQWQEHIGFWAEPLFDHLIVVQGNRNSRTQLWLEQGIIYLTTYDILANDVLTNKNTKNKVEDTEIQRSSTVSSFDLVLLDEAHRISNPESNRFKGVIAASKDATYRWALTGTPIQNRLEDLIALFRFVNPSLLSSEVSKNPETAVIQSKIAPYVLRRTKKDVWSDLPEKTRQEIWLDLDDEQYKEYRRAAMKFRDEMLSLGESASTYALRTLFRRSVTHLKQICNFAPTYRTSPKVEDLKDRVRQIQESGHKVIVFSQFIGEGVDKIHAFLDNEKISAITLTGSTSARERAQIVQKFKTDPETTVLIASVKAAGEGLNLTEASYVIHFDHWWNPATMNQAEDRVHRKGQKHPVTVYSYWMSETIDERIKRILQAKQLMFSEMFDELSDDQVYEQISSQDIREILGFSDNERQKAKPRHESEPFYQDLDTIRQEMLRLTPRQFEEMVKGWLRFLGYQRVQLTGGSYDEGIDIKAYQGDEMVIVQCKRYNPVNLITPDIARELYGTMKAQNVSKSILVTTSDFTDETIRQCRSFNIQTFNGVQLAVEIRKGRIRLENYLKD